MATINTLCDPLIKEVVLHVFNKFRHDVMGKDGTLAPSKRKYRYTSDLLANQYGIIMTPEFIKSKNADLLPFYTPEWSEQDKSWNDQDKVAAVMAAYNRALTAGPSVVSASSTSATTIPPATVTALSDARLTRHLTMIHSELQSISTSLRVIANVISSGTSRGKAKESIENLLNTPADEDESDDDVSVNKSKLTRGKRELKGAKDKKDAKKRKVPEEDRMDIVTSSDEEEDSSSPAATASTTPAAEDLTQTQPLSQNTNQLQKEVVELKAQLAKKEEEEKKKKNGAAPSRSPFTAPRQTGRSTNNSKQAI